MASQNLKDGVTAIQSQQFQEGQRLLKIALKKDSLPLQERVLALLWLAETYTDPQIKIQYYQQANQIDPNNQDVIQHLKTLQQEANNPQGQNSQQGYSPPQGMPASNTNNWQTDTQGMPLTNPNMPPNQNGWQGNPPPNNTNNWQTDTQGMPLTNPNIPSRGNGLTDSQGMPPLNLNQQGYSTHGSPAVDPQGKMKRQGNGYGKTPPFQIQEVQRSVGIFGGPNGSGTGFFVTLDGLIVTTRYIVGGEENMRVQLLSGQYLEGQVVRSFPEFDISLIQVNAQLSHVMTATQMTALPPNMDIVAVPHAGDAIKSTIRVTRNAIAPHWFPTVINDMPDAGGYPVFDGQRLLVGMLTKNASRSNQYLYGLNIYKIYQCVNIYEQEKQQLAGHKTSYCYACGQISRAPSFGGFFCEHCGNTLPYAVDIDRFPQPNLGTLYGELAQSPCPSCHSHVGFYNGECQRCGYEL